MVVDHENAYWLVSHPSIMARTGSERPAPLVSRASAALSAS